MHVHEEILAAANEIVAQPGSNGVFRMSDVLRRLPHLNERTVRTHVGSRCCVNAPKNHPHKWNYFRRIGRGEYEILPEYRLRKKKAVQFATASPKQVSVAKPGTPLRGTIHVIVTCDNEVYTAECVEIAVVTQGNTLDDLLRNLHEAIELHLAGEDLATLGLSPQPRLQILYEAPVAV